VIFAELSTDPTAGVGIFAALAAGIVSFLSPCVLPLVPGYLSAVSGVSAADLETAVKHGSTCVRVGTALLGQRPLTSP